MKTRIIYHNAYGRYRRAIHPDDAKAMQLDDREQRRVPYFFAGGERREVGGMVLTQKGLVPAPKRIEITDEKLVLEEGYESIKFVYGKAHQGKTIAKVISQEDAEVIDATDREITRLEAVRQEQIKNAFQRGKVIVRGDAQYWTKQK